MDWASGYAIAGYCMTHGVPAYAYAFWQSFGPCLLLLLIQVVRKDLWLARSGLVYAILCGVFGIVIPNLLIYFAAQHLPSAILTVIANIAPLFTYILAILFKDEKFQGLRCGLVSLGLLGIGLIILPNQHSLGLNLGSNWLWIALFIPLSYAFSSVYVSKFYPGQGNVLNYAFWMLMVATLCVSSLAVLNHGYYELRWRDLNSELIILEILLSTVGYILLFIILQRVGAVYYSLVNAVAVVSGVFYGWLIFDQHFTLLTMIAIGIILISIVGLTISQGQLRRAKESSRAAKMYDWENNC